MNAKTLGAAAAALIAATALAACGSDAPTDSPLDFKPVTGDEFTSNPGAFQTDGVPIPERGVNMVGDPVPAQAVANAGLQQGTITATSEDTTVYYPKAPEIPGLPVEPDQIAPPPPQLQRPVDTRPWNYTQHQITVYRQICETGRWNDWTANAEIQSQTCWTVYGRQLGVRPWYPGQPKPWERPTWPKPWYDPAFHADVPVMWVYPPDWNRPRPQPLISVSIGINIPDNPYARPEPRHRDEPYFPVWAVTPGRPVAARDQSHVVAPWLPGYATSTTVTSTTTTYVAPPVFPGVTLAPIPSGGSAELVTAKPGDRIAGNPNSDAAVLAPTAAALRGATLYSGSLTDITKLYGKDVGVRTATRTARAKATTTTSERTTRTTGAATITRSRSTTTDSTRTTTGKTRTATAPSGTRERTTTTAPSSAAPKTTTTARPKSSTKATTTEKTTTTAKTTTRTTTTTPKRTVTTTASTTTTAPAR